MKTLLTIITLTISLFIHSQDVFVSLEAGGVIDNDLNITLGVEKYLNDNISIEPKYIRTFNTDYDKIHNFIVTFGYDVIRTHEYTLSPKIGVTFYGKPVVEISNYIRLSPILFISINARHIIDDNFTSINTGLSLNLSELLPTKNYK